MMRDRNEAQVLTEDFFFFFLIMKYFQAASKEHLLSTRIRLCSTQGKWGEETIHSNHFIHANKTTIDLYHQNWHI